MLRRAVLATCLVALFGLATGVSAAKDATLVGWWWFDEGAGSVARDSSTYGNNGTMMGSPTWTTGCFGRALQLDGTNDYVEVPHDESLCVTTGVTVMAWIYTSRYEYPSAGYQGILSKSNSPRSYSLYTTSSGYLHFSTYSTASSATVGSTSSSTVPQNQWVHVCAMVSDGDHLYYLNGQSAGTSANSIVLPGTSDTDPVLIGNTPEASREFGGLMDDVRIYNRSMTQAEIQQIMTGEDIVAGIAVNPSPEEEATDVPRDTALAWGAGETAATHDVYFSTSFDDVNDASRDNSLGVLVSQGQTETTYDPEGLLAFGQTYYWRIDEVNAAPDYTVFKGQVWSFTVEPYAYPVAPIAATASSAGDGMGPENTINGSGLTDDQHSTNLSDMWLTLSNGLPAWIQYEFDREYKLYELWVWNSNYALESALGYGAKDVTIEYSTDGQTWAQLEPTQLAQAAGTGPCAVSSVVSLGEIAAKYVKLTVNTNWGGFMPQASLSEVRFYYVPMDAREPQPVDGETEVSVDATLQWRPGREAASHQVYLGTDATDLTLADTVTENACDVDLALGQTYFWKVVEVNEAETPSTWDGSVWSFSTEDSILVDGFESYNDDQDAGTAIFQTWIDGYGVSENGSLVGYDNSPFAEQTVVFAGSQSMPFRYNNTSATYAEGVRTFEETQDWTTYGVQTLSLHFFGDSANAGTGQLYVKINGTKILYNGAATDLQIGVWQPWTIDLASTGISLKKVKTLAIGVSGSGATGTLFIDDIRLYPTASETITPVDPGTTGLVAWYKFDGDATDSAGNHDGTATGSPGYTTGKVGKALNMTSDSQYVLVPYSADFAMSTYTVGAWVNVADVDALRAILGTRIGADYTFDFKVTSTAVHSDVGSGSAWLNSNVFVYADQGGLCDVGVWYYLATVVDDATDTIKTYINGALAQTTTFSGTPMFMTSAESLGIGYCSSGEYMHGMIDEVRIYNRVLSDAEMASLAGRTGTIYVAP